MRLVRPGLSAPAAVVAAAVLALLTTGTPVTAVVSYGLALLWTVLLPGTLVVRALRGPARCAAEDLGLGGVLGTVLQAGAFLVAQGIGTPRLVLLWPVPVVLATAAVRRWRAVWHRQRYTDPPTAAWTWSVSAVLIALIGWAWATFMVTHPLTGPAGPPYIDLEFHLALAGELRHHLPPRVPFVAGEPLSYHWFGYLHLAAGSVAGGCDLQLVVLRLWYLPVLLTTALLTAVAGSAVVGHRRSGSGQGSGQGPGQGPGQGRRAAGPLAAAVAWLSGDLVPTGWADHAAVADLRYLSWGSPTEAICALCVAGLLVLLIDVVRGRFRWGDQVMVAAVLVYAAGCKASAVPVVAAGLVAVIGGRLVCRRAPTAGPLLALLTAGASVTAVMFLLLGGAALGLGLDPPGVLWHGQLLADAGGAAAQHGASLVLVLALVAAGMLARFTGGVAVLPRLGDPAVRLLSGIVLAGLIAAALTRQPGGSEVYFLRAAVPAAAVLTAYGLVVLAECLSAVTGIAAAGPVTGVVAAIGSASATVGLRMATARKPAAGATLGSTTLGGTTLGGTTLSSLVQPWLMLASTLAVGALIAAAVVAVTTAQRNRSAVKARVVRAVRAGLLAIGLVLAAAGAGGACVVNPWLAVDSVRRVAGSAALPWQEHPRPLDVTADGIAAARWLRARSDPDDVVATNNHSAYGDVWSGSPGGDAVPAVPSAGFWVSAYSERRVLVQGWAFTARSYSEAVRTGRPATRLPFWDQPLLTANDAVFTAPGAEEVSVLRDRYRVRWLFADRRLPVSPALDRFATRRYDSGPFTVYSL